MTNEVVFATLRDSMLHELDSTVDTVTRGHQRDAVSVARQELPRLVAGLRALIALHVPDEEGFCVQCGRGRWWRRQHAPCRVLLAYHIAIKDFDDLPSVEPAKHRATGRVGS
jgi:hypothetical protein